jgi:hypothetical protein
VISSPGFSVFLALSLLVTLSIKFVVGKQGELGRPDVQGAVVDLLAHQNFNVQTSRGGGLVIEAESGDCHMLILEANAAGGTGDALRTPRFEEHHAKYRDRIAFVFNGRIYPEQPTLKTVGSELWTRLQHRLGFNAGWRPVLAIRASAGCPVEELPWTGIAKLPR